MKVQDTRIRDSHALNLGSKYSRENGLIHTNPGRAKKIAGKKLYHGNSVLNALQFIAAGALLSRNYMIQKGLSITPQLSDIIDIKNKIFDAVFLETSCEESVMSSYGPVVFVFNEKILENKSLNPIGRFLKSNPESWDDDTEKLDKYLPKRDALTTECLILYHCSGFLPFYGALERIEIYSSLQTRQKKKEGIRGPKFKPDLNYWSGGRASFEDVAKLNLERALKQAGIKCSVRIVEKEIAWKSKMTNWIRMMYFPGKIFTYGEEIRTIFAKRRFNKQFRDVLEAQLPLLKDFYSISDDIDVDGDSSGDTDV